MNLNYYMLFRFTRKMTLRDLITNAQSPLPGAYQSLLKTILKNQICEYLHDKNYLKINMVLENIQQSIHYYFGKELIKNENDISNFVTAALLDLSKTFGSIN